MKLDQDGRWVRSEPSASGPNRSFGGYYRSSDRVIAGKVFRGVPLQTAEDAVVAAVQMGYRVVDAQIERGMRTAQSLRGAAERHGSGDPGQMLDAGERLATKAVLSGLQWLETASMERGSPVKRLIAAEYRMLGAVLGLKRESSGKRGSEGRRKDRSDAAGEEARQEAAGDTGAGRAQRLPVKVMHEKGSAMRAVKVRAWELQEERVHGELKVHFFKYRDPDPIELDDAYVSVVDGLGVLRISTRPQDPGGRWRAAVCSADGEQLGVVEIEL